MNFKSYMFAFAAFLIASPLAAQQTPPPPYGEPTVSNWLRRWSLRPKPKPYATTGQLRLR